MYAKFQNINFIKIVHKQIASQFSRLMLKHKALSKAKSSETLILKETKQESITKTDNSISLKKLI